jgi:fused signal recognition particle receptor
MAEKKKRGFLSKLGFRSKDETLAAEAAEHAAQQQLIDDEMAARMAAINAAALASARVQDGGVKALSAEELAAQEAEDKRHAEIQAARDVERAKQLVEEKVRRAAEAAADREAETARIADAAQKADARAARDLAEAVRHAAEQKARADAVEKLNAERDAEIAKAESDAEATELSRIAAEERAEQARLDAARQAEDARAAEDRRLAEAADAANQAEEARLKTQAERLAREAEEAERRAARAADRKAREQAETEERARIAAERAAQKAKEQPTPEPEIDVTADGGFLDRITKGLRRSTSRMSDQMAATFNQRTLDTAALEDLEDILIMADLGTDVATKVCASLAADKFDKTVTDLEIKVALAETISDIMTPLETPFVLGLARPQVILFVGVNGSGKTTTLGKIAKRFGDQGKKVLICAADTFRAAAVEQLTVWGDRAGAPVMSGKPGADAASLVYDAMNRARDEDYDILMIDTAGRLQNRTELMDELAKIIRVIEKTDPSAPHHSVLVLDATVGQNALLQVEAFKQTANVSGLIMTKLDGTAKGGVLVALSDKNTLPIHYIGIGEAIDALETFSAPVFAAALSGVADAVSR